MSEYLPACCHLGCTNTGKHGRYNSTKLCDQHHAEQEAKRLTEAEEIRRLRATDRWKLAEKIMATFGHHDSRSLAEQKSAAWLRAIVEVIEKLEGGK